MRIGFDAKRLFCNHRGLGNYSRDLIKILNQYYPENQYDLFTPKIKIDFPINPKNTQIIQPAGIYNFLPSSVWRSYGMKADIERLGDDIFHGLSQELPIGIEKLAVKKVITFHDAIFVRYPELYPSSYRKVFTLKNLRSCKISDRIIAISEQSKRDAIEFFNSDPSKVEVIYQGCNNIFRQKATSEEKTRIQSKYNLPTDYLLFVGAIEPRKNISAILEAIANEKIETPLVLVGRETDYTKELKSLAEKLKISYQVHFLHQVETVDLPTIYQMAQLFIYPSIFEGFGIPILEALCSETPVITSTGSCFEETGGESSLYVHPQNAEEIGAAILKVLSDTKLQETMKSEGLIHAEKFTDDKIADRLMNFYRSI
ncbi:MAG: glycosyltransferase family 1 protein [Paludibacter sp.]